ncbi:MAG: ATP-binding protein [archaeon]
MAENEENTPRVHKIKRHRDPYNELMGLPDDQVKEESLENEVEQLVPLKRARNKKGGFEVEEEESHSESAESEPETDEMPEEEENEYADLLMEQGTHEEGIDEDDPAAESEDDEGERSPSASPQIKNPQSMTRRETIKEQLIMKARGHATEDPSNVMKLELLEMPGKKSLFIGRKKGVMQKSGLDGALYIGKVQDDERFKDHKLFLDSLNPHVVFVCGARGSGKSYVLGVLAEELALKNTNVGTVVVDPVGVFWSMKYPNKEEREVKDLPHFDLMPQGLENLRVFIPEGMKSETPKSTYDSLFSIPPALLTSEDWCLTFGIDRFSPTGLLMEKALKKVEKGYRNTAGESIKGKKEHYSLNDLISCLELDAELNSKEKGYRTDSVRALVSRFEAAKSWGIFSERGTPLSEISKAGQMTVIDTSFLDDTVSALVIGILARRLLAARKLQTRKEAAEDSKERSVESLLENEIPPTWLFIDEAHTLIPSGNVSTPATNAIVEYVKQGRRPGCSLVFATQQPSAIDTRVLSQLDVIMSHKLIFDDDIKAVTKRTPTIIPMKYKHPHFLKTLPVGTALVGDRREETNRAFVLRIRPRMSQHEGRDAETGEKKRDISAKDVEKLAVELLLSKLQREGRLEKEIIEQVLQTLNQKYKQKMMLSNVLDELESRGAKIDPKTEAVFWPASVEEELKSSAADAGKGLSSEAAAEAKVDALNKLVQPPRPEEDTGLRAFPISLSNEQVVHAFQKSARKGMLGLGAPVEKLQEIALVYAPVYRVEYRLYTGKTSFVQRTCFIDAEKGEFLHLIQNQFVSSQGLDAVSNLSENDFRVVRALYQHPNQRIPDLMRRVGMDERSVKHTLVKLVDRKLIDVKNPDKVPAFSLSKGLDLPLSGNEKELASLTAVKLVNVSTISSEKPVLSEDKIHTLLASIWSHVLVTKTHLIYRPFYEGLLINPRSQEHRTVRVDAHTGRVIEE